MVEIASKVAEKPLSNSLDQEDALRILFIMFNSVDMREQLNPLLELSKDIDPNCSKGGHLIPDYFFSTSPFQNRFLHWSEPLSRERDTLEADLKFVLKELNEVRHSFSAFQKEFLHWCDASSQERKILFVLAECVKNSSIEVRQLELQDIVTTTRETISCEIPNQKFEEFKEEKNPEKRSECVFAIIKSGLIWKYPKVLEALAIQSSRHARKIDKINSVAVTDSESLVIAALALPTAYSTLISWLKSPDEYGFFVDRKRLQSLVTANWLARTLCIDLDYNNTQWRARLEEATGEVIQYSRNDFGTLKEDPIGNCVGEFCSILTRTIGNVDHDRYLFNLFAAKGNSDSARTYFGVRLRHHFKVGRRTTPITEEAKGFAFGFLNNTIPAAQDYCLGEMLEWQKTRNNFSLSNKEIRRLLRLGEKSLETIKRAELETQKSIVSRVVRLISTEIIRRSTEIIQGNTDPDHSTYPHRMMNEKYLVRLHELFGDLRYTNNALQDAAYAVIRVHYEQYKDNSRIWRGALTQVRRENAKQYNGYTVDLGLIANRDTETVLSTKRLMIRPVAIEDLTFIAALRSDETVMSKIAIGVQDPENTFGEWNQANQTHTKEFGYGYFMVFLKDGTPLGYIGLHPVEGENSESPVEDLEIGYIFAEKHWGHGYAKEASMALLEFASTNLFFNRIKAIIATDNGGSISVAEGIGMSCERSDDYKYKGRDCVIYSIDNESVIRKVEIWQNNDRGNSAS